MTKGYRGESCAEAYAASIAPGEVVSFTKLKERVAKLGPWKQETLAQHAMQLVVNLPPARMRWKSARPFLFLRPDGQYERYDERQHPKPVE